MERKFNKFNKGPDNKCPIFTLGSIGRNQQQVDNNYIF